MRPISHSLQEHDLIVLRVIGEWWELDLTGEEKPECIQILSEKLPNLNLQQEINFLPPEEADALNALVRAGGRIPLAQFSRQFGEIREMGPAALAREEPWFNPENPAEDLWYRGFLFKGFDETPEGLVEFIYLPDEYIAQFAVTSGLEIDDELDPEPVAAIEEAPKPLKKGPPPPVKPVAPPIFAVVPAPEQRAADDNGAVDDVTTLLTLAQVGRLGNDLTTCLPFLGNQNEARGGMLVTLAEEAGLLRLIDDSYRPTRSAINWLQGDREQALRQLAEAWAGSDWNELRHLPGLICEGSGWFNDPISARNALLDILPRSTEWFRLTDVISSIKKENSDFQRPNGNYNTWYIRDTETNKYLSGFESWDQVEGHLLRFLVEESMTWLGLAQTAGDKYHLTERAVTWLEKEPVVPPENIREGSLVVQADGTLLIPPDGNRYHRFQAGRIADLLPATAEGQFTYRITARTLMDAKGQGITPERVLAFLQEAGKEALPASARRSIERWAEFGTEARLENTVVLRVAKIEILETLRQHPKTRPFLRESLGDLAAAVDAAAWSELVSAAAQLGLLLEPPES